MSETRQSGDRLLHARRRAGCVTKKIFGRKERKERKQPQMKAGPSISPVRGSGGHWILPTRSDPDCAIRSMALRFPASSMSRFSRRRNKTVRVEIETGRASNTVRLARCRNSPQTTGLRLCLWLSACPGPDRRGRPWTRGKRLHGHAPTGGRGILTSQPSPAHAPAPSSPSPHSGGIHPPQTTGAPR